MKYTFYILLGSLLLSCSGIKKYKDSNIKRIDNPKQIEGVYSNFESDTLQLHHRSLNGQINWRRKHKDTTEFTSMKIKILNDKTLKLDFLTENKILKSRILKYRLRNNGFIKLRNQNFRVSGIPYIIGEYDVVKYQLGLTNQNDLIMCAYHEHAGGLLIVLSSGRSFNISGIYKNLE